MPSSDLNSPQFAWVSRYPSISANSAQIKLFLFFFKIFQKKKLNISNNSKFIVTPKHCLLQYIVQVGEDSVTRKTIKNNWF